MKPYLFLFVIAICFVSCDHVYKEYEKEQFGTLSWRGQKVFFYPEIDDTTKQYDLYLGIRHTYGIKLNAIDVSLKIISPSGKELSKHYNFPLKDLQGEQLASCTGNLCDLETKVDVLKFQEPGRYKVEVTQTSGKLVFGIVEFGLILKEAN